MYHVYILNCEEGSFYTGMAKYLENPLEEHVKGLVDYTKSRKIIACVYKESFFSKKAAAKREKQIKGWSRRKKLLLIEGKITQKEFNIGGLS